MNDPRAIRLYAYNIGVEKTKMGPKSNGIWEEGEAEMANDPKTPRASRIWGSFLEIGAKIEANAAGPFDDIELSVGSAHSSIDRMRLVMSTGTIKKRKLETDEVVFT